MIYRQQIDRRSDDEDLGAAFTRLEQYLSSVNDPQEIVLSDEFVASILWEDDA